MPSFLLSIQQEVSATGVSFSLFSQVFVCCVWGRGGEKKKCEKVCEGEGVFTGVPALLCVFVCHQSLLSECNTYLLLCIKGNGMIHLLQIFSFSCFKYFTTSQQLSKSVLWPHHRFLVWRWGVFFLGLSSDFLLLSTQHLLTVSESHLFLINLFLTVYLS